MEYVITIGRPFEEIVTLIRGALERHGFSVHRTFDLRSATGPASGKEQPGYSVFLICRSDAHRQPLGLLVLYRRGAQTVIKPISLLAGDADLAAELAGTLVLIDLEMCINAAGSEKCIDFNKTRDEMRPKLDRA